MLKNYTIAKRLRIAFFWVSMLVALSGAIGLLVIHVISARTDIILQEKYPISREAQYLATSVNAELLAIHSYLLKQTDALAELKIADADSVQHIQALKNMITLEENKKTIGAIQDNYADLEHLTDEIIKLSTTDAGQEQALNLVKKVEGNISTLLADITQIVKRTEAAMTNAMTEADSFQSKSFYTLIAITLLAFLLAFWLGQRVSNGITRPLNTLVTYSKQVAGGDLSKEVALTETKDEIGALTKSFGAMIENLRHQLQEILDGTTVIASSVSELSASSAQLASSSAENATSINETTTTVEEVRQTTELASAKAQQMADESRHIRETSKQGRKATDDTIESMNKIQNQMNAIAETIIRLSEQSQAIGMIIATVDSISEQSNVLAVNASIEAAKAGEHGKGFSVVAQEVKSLAQQSKQATTQVRNILNEIQKATSTAVMATEQGGKVVEKGTETAGLAGKSIIALTEGLDQSADAATQIASASQQQRVGMDQITSAMESVREASQQNAASAKQLEGAVHNLKMLGEKLKGIVGSYRI
jgi:methyl-accepting chemotaxis protein